jgi:hypothetical protein
VALLEPSRLGEAADRLAPLSDPEQLLTVLDELGLEVWALAGAAQSEVVQERIAADVRRVAACGAPRERPLFAVGPRVFAGPHAALALEAWLSASRPEVRELLELIEGATARALPDDRVLARAERLDPAAQRELARRFPRLEQLTPSDPVLARELLRQALQDALDPA